MGLFDWLSSNPSPETLSNSQLEKHLELEYAWSNRNMTNFDAFKNPSFVKEYERRKEYLSALRKERDCRKAIKKKEVETTMFLLLVAHEASLNNGDVEKGRQILMGKIEEATKKMISCNQRIGLEVNVRELEDASLSKLFYEYVDELPKLEREAIRFRIIQMYQL